MTQTYDVLCVNTTSLKTFSFTVSKTVQKMLQTDHYVDFCFVFVFAFLFCLIFLIDFLEHPVYKALNFAKSRRHDR